MAATKKIRVDRTYSTDNDTEDKGAASLVEKARQLNTSRTINGVGFNGTANISFGTDSVSEGSNNLYFTNARARSALSGSTGISYNSSTGAISCTITQYADSNARAALSAGTGLTYNSSTGVFTNSITQYTDALARAAISVSGSLSYNSSTGVISYTTPSTSGITEGTNLYYTDARARAAVSFTAGSGAYNSATGVFTIPTNTNQLTNGAGFITGYTETDTLATVTGRGASTSTAVTFSNATASTTTSTGAVIVSGGVGIGGKLNVGGGAAITGALTATGEVTAYYSDLRLKTNIVQIADALEKVEAINGVTFDPNETALALGIDNKHQMGVIAQEIEAVAPELVTESAFEGYKTVKYDKLTALLIEAVKELSAKVKTLEAQLGNTKPTL